MPPLVVPSASNTVVGARSCLAVCSLCPDGEGEGKNRGKRILWRRFSLPLLSAVCVYVCVSLSACHLSDTLRTLA